MSNIIIAENEGTKKGYYESIGDALDRLEKIKSGWFSSRLLETGEKLKTSFYYVLREHAKDLLACYEQQDWASIAQLPREEDGTAYQLKIHYVPSKKFIGVQIIEARTGNEGGYFNIVPAILYFGEEAEKVFSDLEKLFE